MEVEVAEQGGQPPPPQPDTLQAAGDVHADDAHSDDDGTDTPQPIEVVAQDGEATSVDDPAAVSERGRSASNNTKKKQPNNGKRRNRKGNRGSVSGPGTGPVVPGPTPGTIMVNGRVYAAVSTPGNIASPVAGAGYEQVGCGAAAYGASGYGAAGYGAAGYGMAGYGAYGYGAYAGGYGYYGAGYPMYPMQPQPLMNMNVSRGGHGKRGGPRGRRRSRSSSRSLSRSRSRSRSRERERDRRRSRSPSRRSSPDRRRSIERRKRAQERKTKKDEDKHKIGGVHKPNEEVDSQNVNVAGSDDAEAELVLVEEDNEETSVSASGDKSRSDRSKSSLDREREDRERRKEREARDRKKREEEKERDRKRREEAKERERRRRWEKERDEKEKRDREEKERRDRDYEERRRARQKERERDDSEQAERAQWDRKRDAAENEERKKSSLYPGTSIPIPAGFGQNPLNLPPPEPSRSRPRSRSRTRSPARRRYSPALPLRDRDPPSPAAHMDDYWRRISEEERAMQAGMAAIRRFESGMADRDEASTPPSVKFTSFPSAEAVAVEPIPTYPCKDEVDPAHEVEPDARDEEADMWDSMLTDMEKAETERASKKEQMRQAMCRKLRHVVYETVSKEPPPHVDPPSKDGQWDVVYYEDYVDTDPTPAETSAAQQSPSPQPAHDPRLLKIDAQGKAVWLNAQMAMMVSESPECSKFYRWLPCIGKMGALCSRSVDVTEEWVTPQEKRTFAKYSSLPFCLIGGTNVHVISAEAARRCQVMMMVRMIEIGAVPYPLARILTELKTEALVDWITRILASVLSKVAAIVGNNGTPYQLMRYATEVPRQQVEIDLIMRAYHEYIVPTLASFWNTKRFVLRKDLYEQLSDFDLRDLSANGVNVELAQIELEKPYIIEELKDKGVNKLAEQAQANAPGTSSATDAEPSIQTKAEEMAALIASRLAEKELEMRLQKNAARKKRRERDAKQANKTLEEDMVGWREDAARRLRERREWQPRETDRAASEVEGLRRERLLMLDEVVKQLDDRADDAQWQRLKVLTRFLDYKYWKGRPLEVTMSEDSYAGETRIFANFVYIPYCIIGGNSTHPDPAEAGERAKVKMVVRMIQLGLIPRPFAKLLVEHAHLDHEHRLLLKLITTIAMYVDQQFSGDLREWKMAVPRRAHEIAQIEKAFHERITPWIALFWRRRALMFPASYFRNFTSLDHRAFRACDIYVAECRHDETPFSVHVEAWEVVMGVSKQVASLDEWPPAPFMEPVYTYYKPGEEIVAPPVAGYEARMAEEYEGEGGDGEEGGEETGEAWHEQQGEEYAGRVEGGGERAGPMDPRQAGATCAQARVPSTAPSMATPTVGSHMEQSKMAMPGDAGVAAVSSGVVQTATAWPWQDGAQVGYQAHAQATASPGQHAASAGVSTPSVTSASLVLQQWQQYASTATGAGAARSTAAASAWAEMEGVEEEEEGDDEFV